VDQGFGDKGAAVDAEVAGSVGEVVRCHCSWVRAFRLRDGPPP
jgi:hypothetical protein